MMPLPLSLIIILIGLVLLVGGRQKLGRVGVALGCLVIALSSSMPFAQLITKPLERTYPAYAGQPVSYVVVLGGGHVTDDYLPVSSVLSSASLTRLVEGIRVYRLNSGAKLVLSGYSGSDSVPHAIAMKRVALALGIPEQDIIAEPRPRDTREEAQYMVNIVNESPFALVTSASHMARAVSLFKGQGLDPIASPTYFSVKEAKENDWRYYLPRPDALAMTQMAWHEYLGRAWGWMTKE
ncbi:ElyC/SanA/YdcF family protein [Alkalimarinus coralli]|nr:ElyC/SanA/YdcF family protein [Alkalimarinus coralli]